MLKGTPGKITELHQTAISKDDMLKLITELQRQNDKLAKMVKIMDKRMNNAGRMGFPLSVTLEDGKENGPDTKQSKLARHVVENVDSVVGLKEVMTAKNHIIKIIWVLVFIAGLCLTAFFIYKTASEYMEDKTATSVKLLRQDEYPFPRMAICPTNIWMDFDKALRYNMSMDAIIYATGFFLDAPVPTVSFNHTSGKRDFYDFLRSSHFGSARELLDAISLDFPYEQLPGGINKTSFLCSACTAAATLKKIIMNEGVCYELPLLPVPHQLSNIRKTDVFLQIVNYTNYGVFEMHPTWHLYMTDAYMVTDAIYIDATNFAYIEIRSEQFNLLSTDSEPCTDSPNVNDSTRNSCIKTCLASTINRRVGCLAIGLEARGTRDVDPEHNLLSEYCNVHDEGVVDRMQSVIYGHSVNVSADVEHCAKKCHLPCEQIKHEIKLQQKRCWLASAKEELCYGGNYTTGRCRSGTQLSFEMIASLSGMRTLTESYTFSFSTLISNVGGTLGLFIGATGMTFVQAIMCFTTYALMKFGVVQNA